MRRARRAQTLVRKKADSKKGGDSLQHKIEDLIFTLDVCRKNLPADTHPDHFRRLNYIEGVLKGLDKAGKVGKRNANSNRVLRHRPGV